jgi:hypothetical protein
MQMRMLIALMVFAKNSKGAVKAAHDVVNKKLGTKGLTPNNLYNISRSLDSCTWFQGIIPFGI